MVSKSSPREIKIVAASANVNRTNTDTPAADSQLVIAIGPNETWAICAQVMFDYASATPGSKVQITTPSSPANNIGSFFIHTNIADQITVPSDYNAIPIGNAISAPSIYRYDGVVTTGAAGGNVSVLWSQNTSSADATTRLRGSSLQLTRIS